MRFVEFLCLQCEVNVKREVNTLDIQDTGMEVPG